MRKVCLFLIGLIIFPAWCSAQTKNQANSFNYYIGINPLAIPVACNIQEDAKRYTPIISGLEYGVAVCGGYFLNEFRTLETRISLGNIHQVARVGQWHIGMNYYVFRKLNRAPRNMYAGLFFKFWDYYNRLTKVHFLNISPYISIGYRWDMDPIFLDFRLNQTIAIVSWSSLEHTSPGSAWFFSPWPAFMPVLPTITFTVGWKL